MNIDMGAEAVKHRLEQVSALRELCLSLARSSIGKRILTDHLDIARVRRTAEALRILPAAGSADQSSGE